MVSVQKIDIDKRGTRSGIRRKQLRGPHIYRAYKVFVAHEDVRHGEAKDDGKDPGSNESFNCLFRRELDELCTSKGDAADIGEYVISYD